MTYFRRCGIALDKFLGVVVFGGPLDMTISEHAARENRAGKLWGCWMCRALSALVERNHCGKVLMGQTTAEAASLRALALLLLLYLGLGAAIRGVVDTVFGLF